MPSSTISGEYLYSKTTSDNGDTWSIQKIVLRLGDRVYNSRTIKTTANELYVLFTLRRELLYSSVYPYYYNYDIFYTKSSDNGLTWAEIQPFTKYMGIDSQFVMTTYNDKVTFLLQSDRGGNNSEIDNIFFYPKKFYIGILGENHDIAPPPLIQKSTNEIKFPDNFSPFTATYNIYDAYSISEFKMKFTGDDGKTKEIFFEKQPDLHPETGREYIYKTVLGGMIQPFDVEFQKLNYEFIAKNNKGASTTVNVKNKVVQYENITRAALVDVNKIKLPINNSGVLADVLINGSDGGRFDGNVFLFSGGFAMTGYVDNQLIGNTVMSERRIYDYKPGSVAKTSPKSGNIFILKSSDLPFGESWHEWRYAVADGAKFYDGDNDEIYNPIDKNGNGIWDTNEDKPDLIGDYTAWTCFNDGTPSNMRRWNEQKPLGIEIKQSVFGWEGGADNFLSEILFVRYSIENKNPDNKPVEDVYFSIVHDPDLGNYDDDRVGTDTLCNSTFTYQTQPDAVFGDSVPAYFNTIVQGPVSYIPGVTFVDANSNGIYDEGIDTPLDTAYQMYGNTNGVRKYPGATNQKLFSAYTYIPYHIIDFWSPSLIDVRNMMLGLGLQYWSYTIDPCTYPPGEVAGGVDCSLINPKYFFSGDPITQTGWLQRNGTDIKKYTNTGPFRLEKNKPIDIIFAMIVKRGNSPLNSITLGREAALNAIEFTKNNFSLGISEKSITKTDELISDIGNYPNPFNPITKIKFQLNKSGFVTLNVYDILGRKVKTLISTILETGSHQVDFNASALSSGIYFYEIRTANFQKINKMMVVR
ncbi:MAG TPA: T9SS type A sorting domain-containing protein [Ignavibacteriaceae bacterium]|nr:T9SS type A sorting domain-containing protein [Ignavibacteriaceae bacterium]